MRAISHVPPSATHSDAISAKRSEERSTQLHELLGKSRGKERGERGGRRMFVWKSGKGNRVERTTRRSLPIPTLTKDGISSSSGKRRGDADRRCYRSQLEEEVQILQKQLEQEIDIHTALANATKLDKAQAFLPCNIPAKVQELLSTISALEIAVSSLEEDLISLRFHLTGERCEQIFSGNHLMETPFVPHSSPCASDYPSEQSTSPRISEYSHEAFSLRPDKNAENGPSPRATTTRRSRSMMLSEQPDTELLKEVASCEDSTKPEEISNNSFKVDELKKSYHNLWQHPNWLSEEMVRCMRDIFLHLSESSALASMGCTCRSSSPVGHLSCSSLASFSSSSVMTTPIASPSSELKLCFDDVVSDTKMDPYRVNWKRNKIHIGVYSLAAEISWMVVGKKQLEYAAGALKRFRFLVEQLTKVDPAIMSCNQGLAFWINLYNALIMHAYLAYGVPRSEAKLFSLMQKASYTVGGHSVSAADIKYTILKMKPPAYLPQIAAVLELHKINALKEKEKFSVDIPEPLAVFALSCGMQSSPALRIFTSSNINEELQNSFRDYVRASVGINDKGKLMVPKLLYCFAKGLVEDSLLVDWICRFLSPEQVSAVRNSTSQWKQRLFGARSFVILPFDSRFRYLFLPDGVNSKKPY